MKRILILALCGIAALYGCKNTNKKEDTAMAAIDRFMTEMGASYAPGEYCISWNLIALMSDDDAKSAARAQSIRDYSAANKLDIYLCSGLRLAGSED